MLSPCWQECSTESMNKMSLMLVEIAVVRERLPHLTPVLVLKILQLHTYHTRMMGSY